jgi:hypothetical protein
VRTDDTTPPSSAIGRLAMKILAWAATKNRRLHCDGTSGRGLLQEVKFLRERLRPAGVLEPIGFILRPEVGAISMSGSSVIVAVNALALKRLRLPRH